MLNKSDNSNHNFQNYQNKFRGLISAFKSQRFNQGGKRSPSLNFRSSLRALLLDARVNLHPHHFHEFLSWLNHHIGALLPQLTHIPIGYDELSGVITSAPEASLERELIWITARVKESAEMINAFRANAQKVECLVFKGELDLAIDTLLENEKKFGASLWAIQLRLALEQQAGGLERQKRYNTEVRGIYKRGLLSFIALYTSIRNEDKTTLGKYFKDVKFRIDNHKYFESYVKTYLHYRLAGELPLGIKGIADILRVEQSHSLIDIYETFIAVIQHLVRNTNFGEINDLVYKCINSLHEINDYRLVKARFVITGHISDSDLEIRSTKISDTLITGQVSNAALSAMRMLKQSKVVDCWILIYAGFAFGHSSRERFARYSLPKELPMLLGKVLSRNETALDSVPILYKLLVNLNGLPAAVGITDLLSQQHRFRPDEELRPWQIGLNSPSIGIEDLFLLNSKLKDISFFQSENNNPTAEIWKNFHIPSTEGMKCQTPIAILFAAAGLAQDKKYDSSIALIKNKNIDKVIEPLRSMAISVLLHSHYALGNRQNVIELIADEGSRSEVSRRLLAIRPALETYNWDDYKALSSLLTVCIALHLLWLENESEETISLLRFSTRQFLKDPSVQLPSKLYDKAENYPLHQLIYFLRHVCVPNILDVSMVLKSTQEVMDERQKVCAALRLLDSVNAEQYQEEITFITHMQIMDEGQWMIDRTRIHVDTDALVRWANKELSEAYSRYSDLLTIDVGPQIDLDELLKSAMKDALSKYSSFSPETEADALLINILGKIMEEFLNNPSFGLDFYLSKRIRHQSFIGKIRGPVEFAQLITTRESESGGYHPNREWLEKFSNISEESKLAISEAFTKFSTKFDEALISAKDNNFQIRSPEQPEGLLFLSVSPKIIFFIREISRMDKTIEDFINTTVLVLWAAIVPSLAEVRQFITGVLKTNAAVAFDELRATVKRYANDENPAFLDLDVAIGNCSTEVQNAFNETAQWFQRSEDDKTFQRSFDLEQMLDIAIKSALKCQRAFDPIITKKVIDADIKLTASTLIFLHDVIFVALDNVRAHSGIKKPKIDILAQVNIEDETFLVEVRSETKTYNRLILENDLNEIRNLISAGLFESRTRKEGKSGFLKLAAEVHQNPKGKIDFGINNAGEFQLRVIYSLILDSIPEENLHG